MIEPTITQGFAKANVAARGERSATLIAPNRCGQLMLRLADQTSDDS